MTEFLEKLKQRIGSSVTDIPLLIITLVKRPYPFDKNRKVGYIILLNRKK